MIYSNFFINDHHLKLFSKVSKKIDPSLPDKYLSIILSGCGIIPKTFFFLLKINKKKKLKYLEILLSSEIIDNDYLRNFILNLHSWSHKKNYCYIKILLKKKKIVICSS